MEPINQKYLKLGKIYSCASGYLWNKDARKEMKDDTLSLKSLKWQWKNKIWIKNILPRKKEENK